VIWAPGNGNAAGLVGFGVLGLIYAALVLSDYRQDVNRDREHDLRRAFEEGVETERRRRRRKQTSRP
jgi:hypothetical protein